VQLSVVDTLSRPDRSRNDRVRSPNHRVRRPYSAAVRLEPSIFASARTASRS